MDKDGAECSRSLYSRIVLVAYSTCLVSRIIGVLLGVLGGAAAQHPQAVGEVGNF